MSGRIQVIRVLSALLVAPAIAPMMYTGYLMLDSGEAFAELITHPDFSRSLGRVYRQCLPLNYAIALFVGLPYLWLLSILSNINYRQVTLGSTLGPVIAGGLTMLTGGDESAFSMNRLILYAATGFVVGTIYYLIAHCRYQKPSPSYDN